MLPAKLKTDCFGNIDHAMHILGIYSTIGISLLDKEHEGHISTTLVIEYLFLQSSLEITWQSLHDVHVNSDHQLLLFDNEGNTFISTEQSGGLFRLQKYFQPNELVEDIYISVKDMVENLGIYENCMILKKQKVNSSTYSPIRVDEKELSKNKSHYSIWHFRQFHKTIFSIISISVVLALLGVITPLGFQTFTDKILPYQAQNNSRLYPVMAY